MEIRETVGNFLTAYMVPDIVMVLDELPLTSNGKLDRRALPEPTVVAREFRAPVTDVEQAVASVFAEVLGVERVGLDDDFFALGGNSLVATRVVARLGEALGTRVLLRTLFDAPIVEQFAGLVAQEIGNDARVPLVAQERPEVVPLSLAQQRMWFLNRLDPESTVYNIPLAIRLRGALNVDALQQAVIDLLERHEILRTVYPEIDGVGHQVILPVGGVALDLNPVSVSEADLLPTVLEFMNSGFDVTVDVPVRARLYEVARDEYIFVVIVHHVAADGFSMGPLTRDVMVAYDARRRGEAPSWAPLTVQYADYALWQRELLGSEDDPASPAAREIAYWIERLGDVPEPLDLPLDRPRPPVASNRGARHVFDIDATSVEALQRLAREHNATTFMVVHAALAVLLSKLAGTRDVTIGTPVAGRGEAELDDLIGMFVNTLVLRTDIDPGLPFTELLAQVRETDLGAFANANVPFERLVEVLDLPRSQARTPLFQVMLAFQNMQASVFELDELTVAPLEADFDVARYDLRLTLTEGYGPDLASSGMFGEITYATDLFESDTIEALVQRFHRVIAAIVSVPSVRVGDIDILHTSEHALLQSSHSSGRTFDTLVTLFDAQVARTPNAPALVGNGESLTYAEFDSRANALARYLISRGVGPGVFVALVMRRSLDMLIAMYAVAKAGGAYVPVDPDLPVERNDYVLAMTKPVVIVAESGEVASPAAEVVSIDSVDLSHFADHPVSDTDRNAALRPDHIAYVIFTSGSTGRPKGVALPHSAVVASLSWRQNVYDLGGDDTVLQKTPFTFDASVREFWWPLTAGARLVIAEPDAHRDPRRLVEAIAEHGVTSAHFVPSVLTEVVAVAEPTELASLRQVFCGGEVFSPALVASYRAVNGVTKLSNEYGPTEAAVSVTRHAVASADKDVVPIGTAQTHVALTFSIRI